MSLYHEAASILDAARQNHGSLKSHIFTPHQKTPWKTDPKTLFALTSEVVKWSAILAEVIDRSCILDIEKQLSPILSVLLVHDLLLSKRGIALPAKHGLYLTISRHKARLTSELTKARIRAGFTTLDQLREHVNSHNAERRHHPRWIRINTLKTTLVEQLATTFSDYTQTTSLNSVTGDGPQTSSSSLRIHIDQHIPNLVAITPTVEINRSKAYKDGKLILQDKASCFPACLLNLQRDDIDIIDACAAPGNKTTHLAAVLSDTEDHKGHIIACEKDAGRSQILQKMVKSAGGEDVITIRSKQDFMRLDPTAAEFSNVTALLLDPSCSGSGIVGRDEVSLTIHLPNTSTDTVPSGHKGKKRKRTSPDVDVKSATASHNNKSIKLPVPPPTSLEEQEQEEEQALSTDTPNALVTRLTALSTFQLRIVEHAMSFPAATKITYSTCSIHAEENEHVVVKALSSSIGRRRGWRVLKREEQVDGLKRWKTRGWKEACRLDGDEARDCVDGGQVAEACIRCEKGADGDGTMGFFVVGFVRDREEEDESEEEWNGINDDES